MSTSVSRREIQTECLCLALAVVVMLASHKYLSARVADDRHNTVNLAQALDARVKEVRERAASARSNEDWMEVLRLGEELAALYPEDNLVLTAVARLRTRYAAFLLLHLNIREPAKDYAAIRRQLDWIEDHLLQPPRSDPSESIADLLAQAGQPLILEGESESAAIRRFLQGRASALLADARAAKDTNEALRLLRSATEIWPNLPGLRDEVLKLQDQYVILHVGVRAVPKLLSPSRAVLDSELHALDLLFESLLQTQPTNDGALSYQPQLATTLPNLQDTDRQVTLRKNARWSDGSRVTAADVRKTIELLTHPKLAGRNGEFADHFATTSAVADPFRVHVKLPVGLLDSLSPFTFKVVPRGYGGMPLASADDEAFAKTPVGSGPYVFAGELTKEGRTYVRFLVNPYYQSRTIPGSPRIREILFFAWSDPLTESIRGVPAPVLLLDVPTHMLAALKSTGAHVNYTLPTRRVWFLAVNCRNATLNDQDLRRAFALSINRNLALAECFGGDRTALPTAGIAVWTAIAPVANAAVRTQGPAIHHPLNGPFPAGSWACCTDPRVPANLFDMTAAEALLKKSAATDKLELDLKYPIEDPRVQRACEMIASQFSLLGKRAGRTIKIRLVPLPAHQLQNDLNTRQYDLAYWRHDYPNDTYPLGPLFDPRKEALDTGSNYLGYQDDGTLTELLYKASSQRDFKEAKKLYHDIHVAINERMPLIPLWQLDYHIAYSRHLSLPRVDPLRVFANVEEWKVNGK